MTSAITAPDGSSAAIEDNKTWPWQPSGGSPSAVEWFVSADFSLPREIFRLAVITGRIHAHLSAGQELPTGSWLQVVDAVVESARRPGAPAPIHTDIEHDANGDVTYVPGGESLIWEPVSGEPFSYHFINYYRNIQKRLRAVRDELQSPTPLASLDGLVSDIRDGFAKDGGERLLAICLAETLRRGRP